MLQEKSKHRSNTIHKTYFPQFFNGPLNITNTQKQLKKLLKLQPDKFLTM